MTRRAGCLQVEERGFGDHQTGDGGRVSIAFEIMVLVAIMVATSTVITVHEHDKAISIITANHGEVTR